MGQEEAKYTPLGRKPIGLKGIDTITINAAREMHARTVRARLPLNRNPHPATTDKTTTATTTTTKTTTTKSTDTNIKMGMGNIIKNDIFNTKHSTLVRNTATDSKTMTQTVTAMAPPMIAPTASTKLRHKCNNPNNPPCSHCGTMIIPSPAARMPLEDIPSISIDNWTITSCKKPILNSIELEMWESEYLPGLRALPEMIFGNNFIRIENVKHSWQIEFNALDALKLVSLEDAGIRVAYSKDWIESKKRVNQSKNINRENNEIDVNEVEIDKLLQIVKHYDWTYTTEYKGTIHTRDKSDEDDQYVFQRDDSVELPIDKLSRPDPILYFDDMILYEDELADNGISLLTCKIRVMNERLLLLMRFFLNVDDVILRVYDTRVYVEFDTNEIIREFKKYEGDNETLQRYSRIANSMDPKALLRDSDWVVKHIPLKTRECECLRFSD